MPETTRLPLYVFVGQHISATGVTAVCTPDARNCHFEAEIAVAIGAGFRVKEEDADTLIYGCVTCLHMTRRELQLVARNQGRPVGSWQGRGIDFHHVLGTWRMQTVKSTKVSRSYNFDEFPLSISYQVPLETWITAANNMPSGGNTMVGFSLNLGDMEPSKYIIELPVVHINGVVYRFLSMELERRMFDVGIEPFIQFMSD